MRFKHITRRFNIINSFLIMIVVFVGGVVTPVNAQLACDETQGRTERSDYYADIIQTRMYYTVYLPPCYDHTNADYPVIYLMHGSNDDDNQWLRLRLGEALDAGISSGEFPPLIVVLPFGNWIANENRFDRASWGSVFLDQFIPLVEDQYRIRTQREFRAIGGISRGGFWAFQAAMSHPNLFSIVGGHSAFFDLYHAPPEFNPLHLVRDGEGVETLRIWLDRGRDDFAAPGLEIIHERLTERGLPHVYNVYPEGQHNNAYWSGHVEDYLRFYVEDWLDTPVNEPASALDSPEETAIDEPEAPAETPVPVETATSEITVDGWYVLLPVVAFPSLQSSISADQLDVVRVGLLDDRLVLSEEVAAVLSDFGISLVEGTRIVPAEALYNTLWRDRRLYTLLPFDRLMTRYRVLLMDDVHPLDGDLGEYAFAFSSETPNYYPGRLTRILLSGVTALTRGTRTALDNNGIEWAGEAIAPYVHGVDFFHTSNEVSIYPTCPHSNQTLLGGSFSFCSKAEHFDLLTYLDLDIVELSGNHNNDYGYDAYRDTLQWYADREIMTIGGGETLEDARRPLLLYHNNNTIAMVACNWVGPYYALVNEDPTLLGGVRPGAAFCDLDWLRELLPRLAAENDLVVVTVQYLEFDQYTPTDRQRDDFRMLAQWGADVVVGTHAHFPQTFEFLPLERGGEAFIHFGLGNLFFDQQFFAGRRFFMDQLFIYEGRLLTVDLFTGIIEEQGRPRPMTPDERQNFLYLMFNEHGGF